MHILKRKNYLCPTKNNHTKIKIIMKQIFLCLLLTGTTLQAPAQKNYPVHSPDGNSQIMVTIHPQHITYQYTHHGDPIIHPSHIALHLTDHTGFGIHPKLKTAKTTNIKQTIHAPIYKKTQIEDYYNELELRFKGDYTLHFRIYNDAMAYRFATTATKPFTILDETAQFNLGDNLQAYIPYVKKEGAFEQQYFNSFENTYTHTPLRQWQSGQLAFLPLLAETRNNKKIVITEADLEQYPGMYLYPADTLPNTLRGIFAPTPNTTRQGGHNNLQMLVTDRHPYIAHVAGSRTFPWRIVAVATNDKDLLNNDIVYQLAAPTRIDDTSWIQPGKVAWDWWNDWNISGVDFPSGINNDTYRHYIDFAAEYHLQYVILDEGWAVNQRADLLQVVPQIDLPALTQYAATRNVGLILWAGYQAFDRDMEHICQHYAALGIKGFKIDFMDRDDQQMVDFYYRAAATAARHRLIIDFHGAYKPTGLQRTYPNVLNFEGVNGLEQLKWNANIDQVTYDLTIPFIRQIAGPMDYTPGAMRNAVKNEYAPVYSNPMSQGTRCHQLAAYILFEAPLNMLCDSPSNYRKETDCTTFLAAIPTVWDETVALDAKIAQYAAIARRKNNQWYLAAMTNWDERQLTLDLSFLGPGNYQAEIYRDGVNAHRVATDYKTETIDIPPHKTLTIKMAPGGGFAARIFKTAH
jgi:alpha-glucosidase